MKILVFPRDDQNPYQRMLYGEMERLRVISQLPGKANAIAYP